MHWSQSVLGATRIPAEAHAEFEREWLHLLYERSRVMAYFFLVYAPVMSYVMLYQYEMFPGIHGSDSPIAAVRPAMAIMFAGIFVCSTAVLLFPRVESVSDLRPGHRHLVLLYSCATLLFIDSAFLIVWSQTGLNSPYLVGIFAYTLLFYTHGRNGLILYLFNFLFYLFIIYEIGYHPPYVLVDFVPPNVTVAYVSGAASTVVAWLTAWGLFVAREREFLLRRTVLEQSQSLREANARLDRLAFVDGLTQTANRHGFEERLQSSWLTCTEERRPISLILCDVDFFKRYNDSLGHLAGDDCLRRLAALLQAALPPGDPDPLVGRYGGEEFLVILPRTSPDEAFALAERIRRSIDENRWEHPDSPFGRVTVSAGVATIVPTLTPDPEHLIGLADQALYRAKENGRNQVVQHRPDSDRPASS